MPVHVHAPIPLLVAALIGALAVVLLFRRPLPGTTRALLTTAVVLLAAAAGNLHATLPRGGDIVVMVDLSPSTRGAMYRERPFLDRRLKQLLGRRSYRLIGFAQDQAPLPGSSTLAERPAAHTAFDPPPADAILLFSDGRFEPSPSAPPVYPVIDPALLDPNDAAVDDVRVEDDALYVTVTNRGTPAMTRLVEAAGAPPAVVQAPGATQLRIALKPLPALGRVALREPADPWPENDALAFAAPQPPRRQRWWIGPAAPAGWTSVSPGALAPENFLLPSIIALHNLPAADLPPATQGRLQQYVRDLGGSLLILGGDRAFAAGGYSGSTLDALSPLASDPPTPTTHWLLLTDASGSMAQGGRWSAASAALASVVRELPGADLVSVGSFSADLRWWVNGGAVVDARSKPLPPAGVSPSGPTNLQPVLEQVARSADADLQKHLLLLTDGETSLTIDPLIEPMRAKKLRLHVLAIGDGPALPALRKLAAATGGSYAVELDAGQWLAGMRKLLRSARGEGVTRQAVSVNYTDALLLSSRMTPWFNRTWLKPNATAIANGPDAPLAAVWQVGNGQVAAAGYELQPAELEAFASRLARPPRDPRFRVDWQAAGGRVIVDAVDVEQPLNDLKLDVQLRGLGGGASSLPLTQTAPGRYEARLPTSPQPRLAVLRLGDREIDRRTLAGRYAREFAGIGIDEAALTQLAERTGGRVIGPSDTSTPIPRIWRDTALSPWLAALAAVALAGGLIHWKRS